MTTITEKQYDDLVTRIYNVLISNPEVGLGEMGDCQLAASELVNEWTEANSMKNTINRHTLTASTLEKIRKDTGLNWVDSSYGNDTCDSLLIELANDYSIQVWIPNSLINDPSNEDFARFAYCMHNNNTDGSPLTDNYPNFATYEEMLDSLQLLLAYHSSLYPSIV